MKFTRGSKDFGLKWKKKKNRGANLDIRIGFLIFDKNVPIPNKVTLRFHNVLCYLSYLMGYNYKKKNRIGLKIGY